MERSGGEFSIEQERERRRAIVAHAVVEMVRLFTPGHDAEQTPEFEEQRGIMLQGTIDMLHPDRPEGTHSRFTTG